MDEKYFEFEKLEYERKNNQDNLHPPFNLSNSPSSDSN